MTENLLPLEDARLKSIRIQGFKCFLDTTVPLANLTVLAGGNSVGKSSVIQSLLLLRSALSSYESKNFPIQRKGYEYESRILLNGNFLMNLGTSRDVVTDRKPIEEIRFSIENRQNQTGVIPFEVPLEEENHLIFRGMIADTDPNPFSPDIRHHSLFSKPQFYYLNAERIGPRVLYDIDSTDLFATGWQGEYTIKVLSSMVGERYQVDALQAFEGSENFQLSAQANFWMNYILSGISSIQATSDKTINKAKALINSYKPHNVGFGISYILPIVVSGLLAKSGSMFIVENPEAHLHPLGQSRIGQFLAQMTAAGVQIIIETHSEHVINGIRIAAMKGVLSPDDVAINFFLRNQETEKVEVQQIGLTTSGDLTKFPAGFFDQTQQDLVELIKLKQSKIR